MGAIEITMPNKTTRLKGQEAIGYAEINQLLLCKYADDMEGSREDLTPYDARRICREDPSLIYIDVQVVGPTNCGEPR